MTKKGLFFLLLFITPSFIESTFGTTPSETSYKYDYYASNDNLKLDFYTKNNKMKILSQPFSTKIDLVSKKIMVITDVHIMSEKLIKKDGKAFQEYLRKDRKLLQESRAIANALADSIIKEKPVVVLVCGDLTKDGELLSHQKFTETFKKVLQNGIKMIVIPGNHDINNPDAVYYNGDIVEPAETITPVLFSEIYQEFGFGDAISRDKNSLSYICEPIEGLRVIAIDGCRYYDNNFISRGDEKNLCVTEGRIKAETMQWIKKEAALARNSGKQILAMVHHNVVEHFDFQGDISAPYLLENFTQVQKDFMEAGIQVVFTGHFHANDIAITQDSNNNYLFDVETGSPVTYPCPYRIIEYCDNNKLLLSTRFIESIDHDLKGEDFQQYAKRLIKESIPIVLSSLISEFYPAIKQYANPYSAFIKIPEADKLGQIVEDNLGEIAVNVMMKIYERNENNKIDNITLKKLDKSIENIAGELARTRLFRGRIVKSFNNIDYVKKVKVACHSIFYNMKDMNQQVVLSGSTNEWMIANREFTEDLNYPILLQRQSKVHEEKKSSNLAKNLGIWNKDYRWVESVVLVDAE